MKPPFERMPGRPLDTLLGLLKDGYWPVTERLLLDAIKERDMMLEALEARCKTD